MKICAIIVTYRPDIELLRKNISRFANHVEGIIIWDNTPKEEKEEIEKIINEFNIKVIGIGSNVGISVALNICANIALKQGITHILTMDQDSLWNNFAEFRSYVEMQNLNDIYGPSINGKTNILRKEETHIITSGTLFPLNVLQQIGGYSESLFIDGIDFEICDRARQFGFKIFSTNIGELNQKFGAQIYHNILGKKMSELNYPPSRLYENIKSLVIIGRAYNQEDYYWIKLLYKVLIGNSLKILFFEKNSFQKIIALIKGFISGLIFNLKELETNRKNVSNKIEI